MSTPSAERDQDLTPATDANNTLTDQAISEEMHRRSYMSAAFCNFLQQDEYAQKMLAMTMRTYRSEASKWPHIDLFLKQRLDSPTAQQNFLSELIGLVYLLTICTILTIRRISEALFEAFF